MTAMSLCQPHSVAVRQQLFDDPTLGCGNFLFKTLSQDVDQTGRLFVLDSPWTSPLNVQHEHFSLSEFYQTVASLALWYQECGVSVGDITCVYTSEGISQFLHALALTSFGAIPAPVNCRMRPEITLTYCRKYGFNHLVIDGHENSAHIKLLAGPSEEHPLLPHVLNAAPLAHKRGAEHLRALDGEQSWPKAFGRNDETVMICHSSGTTGIPKAVSFAHHQFFFGKRERLRSFLETKDDRMMSALPHSHSAGFSYLMTAVLVGLPTFVISEPNSASVLAKLREFEPTIMAGFPQTYATMAAASPPPQSLSFLKRCYNTGDTAHEAHIRVLVEAAPDLRFYDGFGASELGMALFCSVSSRANGLASGRCVGRPVPFASARIIDERGITLPDGQVGYVAIRSPTITPGYYRDASLTQRCRTPEGEWITGDVGYLDKEGAFFHLDRAVDVINTPRGNAYSLVLEEALLRRCPISDLVVTGVALSPRTSQLVSVFLEANEDTEPPNCGDVLDVLDELLVNSLGGKVPLAVAVQRQDRGSQRVGATGKSLKRVLREEFWAHYQAFLDQQPSAFTHVAFRNM